MSLDGRTGTACPVGVGEDLPIGEGRAFVVAGEQVAIFRLRDGSLRAVSAVCPHAGGPIADGQTDGRVVICPLHQNGYALDTGLSTSGQEPLRVFAAYLDAHNRIIVELPES